MNTAMKIGGEEFISLLPPDHVKPFVSLHTPRAHSKEDVWDSPLPKHLTDAMRDGSIYAEVSRRDEEKREAAKELEHFLTAPTPRGLKIYLAGPMTGIKEFNFPAFHAASKLLRGHGHEVFNPAEQDMIRHGGIDVSIGMSGDPAEMTRVHGFSLREALRDDTHYICTEANAIAMLPGWEGSKGARAEHFLAYALGHQMLYLGGFYG